MVVPLLPITFKARGMVVRPPTSVRAIPAALRWSLFSLLESKRPIPAPNATGSSDKHDVCDRKPFDGSTEATDRLDEVQEMSNLIVG